MACLPLVPRMLMWMGLAGAFAAAGGCAISQQDEIQIGRDARPQFEQELGGVYPDQQVQDYVNEVGMRVARHAGRSDLPWEFRVLNSDTINAFALPGGFIYISRGLLFSLEDEAQLAGIMAHEAAHIAHRDSVQQLQRAQILQGGAGLAGILSGSSTVADVSQLVGGLVNLKYGRDQEQLADLRGLEYMARAGYDPRAMVEDMQILERLSRGDAPPEFLSNHPSAPNRIEYLQEAVQRNYGDVLSSGERGREAFERNVLDRRGRSGRR